VKGGLATEIGEVEGEGISLVVQSGHSQCASLKVEVTTSRAVGVIDVGFKASKEADDCVVLRVLPSISSVCGW
jgi:hypothetical protein